MPGAKHACPIKRRLLVAGHPADRELAFQQALGGGPKQRAVVANLGKHGLGHAEQAAKLGVPALRVNVVERSPRCVGDVRRVDLTAGQPP